MYMGIVQGAREECNDESNALARPADETWEERVGAHKARLARAAHDPGTQVPGDRLSHVAQRAPTLVRKSGSPERPYRSRSDFKTNRKALPPLHANVSVLMHVIGVSGWYGRGLGAVGRASEAGLSQGGSDDETWTRNLR